jgi:hypothetical protein
VAPKKDSPVLLNLVISDPEIDSVFKLEVSITDPYFLFAASIPPVNRSLFLPYTSSSGLKGNEGTAELKVDST